jgi:hypothetical protein
MESRIKRKGTARGITLALANGRNKVAVALALLLAGAARPPKAQAESPEEAWTRSSKQFEDIRSAGLKAGPTITFTAGGGRTDASPIRYGTVGAFFRVPLEAKPSAEGANVGFELGALYSRGGSEERLLQSVSKVEPSGTSQTTENVYERVSGLKLMEFAGLSLQSAWLGPLSLEVGARLGYGWLDTRTRTEAERTVRTPSGNNNVTKDVLSVGPGEVWSGLTGTAVVAANLALNAATALRLELHRVVAGAPQAAGTGVRMGVTLRI